MNTVILKRGRERSLIRRHPWIFSGAIQSVHGNPAPGETVLIRDAQDNPLAVAAWSPSSQIRCRVWSFKPDAIIDEGFFRYRIQQAINRRYIRGYGKEPDAACRLCYSESDGLPGLIIDKYAHTVVCQFLTAGTEFWRQEITDSLQALLPGCIMYERSDVEVRKKEGLAHRSGPLGKTEPPDWIVIEEAGVKYQLDVRHGHKTGFYLDQRDNRLKVREYSRNNEILNCFSYSGGFALAALAGGAKLAVNIDSSANALTILNDNLRLNGIDSKRVENIEADVFEQLRKFRKQQRLFDVIILDPPKFIDSRQALNRGARAYKDINMQAFALLRPGGILMSFSCSGLLTAALMQKIIADAALDAGRTGQIIARLGQSADHPINLAFPEAEYLKGFCVQTD